MASIFEDIMQGTGWDSLTAVLGKSVTYNPNGGTPAIITALWSPNETLPEYYPDGEQDVALGVIIVSPGDVATPDNRDTFTIDSVVWAVKTIGAATPLISMQLERRVQRGIGPGNFGRVQR